MEFLIRPIGFYRSTAVHPYEAGRQPDEGNLEGEIQLLAGQNFEQALQGLEGFERIWVSFQFHHNPHWKPMVRPPRGSQQKVGVFATRAPYRPNALGLSCLRLKSIEGLRLRVEGADLLDQTPVFDIKPYIPEADAFPQSRVGWLEGVENARWQISFSTFAERQLRWLESQGVFHLRQFLQRQLEYDPVDVEKKRIQPLALEGNFELAYRTWRADFQLESERSLRVHQIHSGYSNQDLLSPQDPWQDKDLHREFTRLFATDGTGEPKTD